MLSKNDKHTESVSHEKGIVHGDFFESTQIEIHRDTVSDEQEEGVNDVSDDELHSLVDCDLGFSCSSADEEQHHCALDESYGTVALKIERFVERMVKIKVDAIDVVEKHGVRRVKEESRLNRDYWLMNFAHEWFVPEYHYSPAVALYYDTTHELRLFGKFRGEPNLPVITHEEGLPENAILADLYNQFVRVLTDKYNSRGIKRAIRKRKEAAEENYESGSEYIRWLIQQFSKLLVVRIDLAFKREIARTIGIEEAAERFGKFLRRSQRKKTIFKYFVGYIAKLEFSRLKGYHYHLILFFNGQFAKAHAYHGEQTGKYWRDDVTGGKGTYYNCNRHPNRYKRCGIGMIGRKDTIKQGNLLYALGYLTKSEQMVAVKTKKGQRTFFRGQPRARKSNAGRPRQD